MQWNGCFDTVLVKSHKLLTAFLEDVGSVIKKMLISICFDSTALLLEISLKEIIRYKCLCIRIFTEALQKTMDSKCLKYLELNVKYHHRLEY